MADETTTDNTDNAPATEDAVSHDPRYQAMLRLGDRRNDEFEEGEPLSASAEESAEEETVVDDPPADPVEEEVEEVAEETEAEEEPEAEEAEEETVEVEDEDEPEAEAEPEATAEEESEALQAIKRQQEEKDDPNAAILKRLEAIEAENQALRDQIAQPPTQDDWGEIPEFDQEAWDEEYITAQEDGDLEKLRDLQKQQRDHDKAVHDAEIANVRRESAQHSQDLALQMFSATYPEIRADKNLFQATNRRIIELETEGMPLLQAAMQAGQEVRDLVNATNIPTDKSPNRDTRKQTKKAVAVKTPSKAALPKKKQEPAQTRTEAINEMRKGRGLT